MSRTRVLDLVRRRRDVLSYPTVPVHELPTGDREPRARWCLPGGADTTRPRGGEEPHARSADRALPLLVVTDGEAHVDRLDTPGLLAAAVHDGRLPPLLAVFVDAGTARAEALGVPGGQASWIAHALVPRMRDSGVPATGTAEKGPSADDDRVRAARDARRTVVTGSSFGGLTALFSLARAPRLLGAAIAQSVSLWRYPRLALAEPLRAAYGAADEAPRIRMHAGRFEGTMAADARELIDTLAGTTGACIPLRVVSGGHDWAWWQPAMVEDLCELLR